MDFKQLTGNIRVVVVQSVPLTLPVSGTVFLYMKSDQNFYVLDAFGTENVIAGAQILSLVQKNLADTRNYIISLTKILYNMGMVYDPDLIQLLNNS